jgi:chromate transporter
VTELSPVDGDVLVADLVAVAALPFWSGLRTRPAAQGLMAGANAAVVGILAMALYNPVWTSAVRGPADVAATLVGLALLVAFRSPPLLVVILGAAYGLAPAG